MKLVKLNYVMDAFSVFMAVDNKYTQLLDSCIRVKDTGNYSFIFFNPKFVISERQGKTYLNESGIVKEIREPILNFIDEYLKSTKPLGTGLVFDGGFVGYIGYDFGMDILNIKRKNEAEYSIPDLCMGYYENFVIIDYENACTYIKTEDKELLNKICNGTEDIIIKMTNNISLSSNFEKSEFEELVEKVRNYIKIGDVYQVNISQQFKGLGKLDPNYLYYRFRNANYGPYNAFLNMEDFWILSTSPEQFLRKRDKVMMTRPIKGTNKKSIDKAENELLKKELLDSEKNRAELLMIVDLERNDLSRICEPATVKVENLYDVEEYATVNHLVSTIKGNIPGDKTFGDIIRNMFPGGSITGAPKLRAMEIIEELENVSRGIYTGSIGYVSNNMNMDFNIAIRTAVVNKEGVFYNVGGGITWDSESCDEYEETLHKGRAIYGVLTGDGEVNGK